MPSALADDSIPAFIWSADDINALIDCGATSLVAMNKLAINRNDINTIFISHFHADHVGGCRSSSLNRTTCSSAQRGLTIAGPPSLKSRYAEIMDVAFPGTKDDATGRFR